MRSVRTLVLGLGNEIVGDDAIGIVAARAVRAALAGRAEVDVVESSASGLALLDVFAGYERAIVVDSILTGRQAPGTIVEMGMDQTGPVVAPSVHQAGLPMLAAVATRLGLGFPTQTSVFAVEVVDATTLGAPMSRPAAAAVPELVGRICARVLAWAEEPEEPEKPEEPPCTTTTPSSH